MQIGTDSEELFGSINELHGKQCGTHWAGATELQDYTPEFSTTESSPSYPSSYRFITLYTSLPFLACPCKCIEVNAEWKINQALPLLVFSFLIQLEKM